MLTCSLKGINMSKKKKEEAEITVIIIGAGPAGLAVAIELKKRNNRIKVVILEREKEISYKVCAGGITAHPLRLGLSKKILDRKFSEIKIFTPRQSVTVKKEGYIAATTNRKKLHEIMAKEAIELGVEILFDKSVKEIENNFVLTSSGEKFKFDYLVGADGSLSVVRKKLELETEKVLTAIQYMIPGSYPDMEFYFDSKIFGDSYGWIFPQKNKISVGAGYDSRLASKKFTAKDLKDNFDIWCKEKFDIEGLKLEGFSINYDYRGFEFGNIFLAGDAAGLASGLTGEGIKFAILSGRDIARKIVDPSHECKEIKKILKIKKYGEWLTWLIAVNPITGRIIIEFCTFFVKTSLGKKIMKNLF